MDKEKDIVVRFDSLSAFVAAALAPTDGLPEKRRASKRTPEGDKGDRESGKSWAGTDTFEEAITLAQDGWHEGAKKSRAISSALFGAVSGRIERDTIVYDVEGSDIDVAAYLKGIPECFMRTETHIVDGDGRKLVRILFNIGANSHISADDMMKKGAMASALIELLEFAGHRVELTIVETTRNFKQRIHSTFVRVKEFDQVLDAGRIAFACIHPAMLRRVWFAFAETQPKDIREDFGFDLGGSYGKSIEQPNIDGFDLYIGGGDDVPWAGGDATIRRWLFENLEKQGVAITKEEV
jgi:hypothetical protein